MLFHSERGTMRPAALCTLKIAGLLAVLWSATCAAQVADESKALDIGDRRELLVDDFLIDKREGLELRLQTPVPREVVMVHDAPWEGSGCGYHTIFRDGD